MCGISGIFTARQIGAEGILSSLAAIQHRGPDDSFIIATENAGSRFFSSPHSSAYTKQQYPLPGAAQSTGWLGFNRLSIVDRSDTAAQPLYDHKRDCIFLMNGEVYNYRELRATYLSDEIFSSDTDTEVAFRLYLKLGDDFVHHLRGMFVIVAFHQKEHTIKVWRDRMGIKPFFYTISAGRFLFSSEMGGIFASALLPRELDPESLAHQFYLITSHSPRTIYKAVCSLEPASCLTVNTHTYEHTITQYWRLVYDPGAPNISTGELYADLKEVADLSVEGVGQNGRALMLSGGLDSGLLALFLKKSDPDIDACCIFSDSSHSFNELGFAKLNALQAGMELDAFNIPEEVPEAMAHEFCRAEEEPNISPEPAYFLASMVNGKNRILYNALGLDELFYGYGHHVKALTYAKYRSLLSLLPSQLLPEGKGEKLRDIRRFGLEAMPFVSRAVAGWEEIKALFADHRPGNWKHPLDAVLSQAKAGFPDFNTCDLMKKISFLDIHFYISSHHSFRSDRPAMLNHLEMRFPYLDHLFIQKYFNVPALEKGLSYSNNKPFLRSHVRQLLHPRVLEMPKKGFELPVENWLKNVDPSAAVKRLDGIASGEAIKNFSKTPARRWLMFSLTSLADPGAVPGKCKGR